MTPQQKADQLFPGLGADLPEYSVTLDQAVEVCRRIEEVISPLGAHCGLTGSCLYKGESKKDLDVVVYSHQAIRAPYVKQTIVDALVDSGLVPRVSLYQTTPNYLDKDVLLCEVDGRRVDLFFFA